MKAMWSKSPIPLAFATIAAIGGAVIADARGFAQDDDGDKSPPPIVLLDDEFGSVESFVLQPGPNPNAAVPPGGKLPDNFRPVPPQRQPGAPDSMPGPAYSPNDLDSRLADLERRILELARDIRDIRGQQSGRPSRTARRMPGQPQ